jgi:hypothetical protein
MRPGWVGCGVVVVVQVVGVTSWTAMGAIVVDIVVQLDQFFEKLSDRTSRMSIEAVDGESICMYGNIQK